MIWRFHEIFAEIFRIRKVLENKSNTEEDRVAIMEQQLAQAKLIAEEADKKYEEVKYRHRRLMHSVKTFDFLFKNSKLFKKYLLDGQFCSNILYVDPLW